MLFLEKHFVNFFKQIAVIAPQKFLPLQDFTLFLQVSSAGYLTRVRPPPWENRTQTIPSWVDITKEHLVHLFKFSFSSSCQNSEPLSYIAIQPNLLNTHYAGTEQSDRREVFVSHRSTGCGPFEDTTISF